MQPRRHVRGNMFVALLALIVVLVSLSILLVGTVSYSVSANALEQETRRAVLLRQAQLQSRLEREMLTYRSIGQGLALNGDVLNQLTATSSRTVSDILRFRTIISVLSSVQMGAPNASVIALVYPRSHSVATNTTRYDAEDFFARYLPDDRQLIEDGLTRAHPFTLQVNVLQDLYGMLPAQQVLLLGKSLPYFSPYPLGGALVEVPIALLQGMLTPEPDTLQMVLGAGGELLFCAADTQDSPHYEGALAAARQIVARPGSAVWQDVVLDGTPHFLSVSVSAQEGWRFVTALPSANIFSGIRVIRSVTLFAGLAAACAATVISLLALRRLYAPIRQLLDTLRVRGVPFQARAQGDNELQHISRMVDMTWRENDNMQHLLHGMREVVRQDVLGCLLDDIAVDDETLAQSGLTATGDHFRVVLMSIAPLDEATGHYALCRYALEQVTDAYPYASDFTCVVRPHNQAALLCRTPDARPIEALLPTLEALGRAIETRAAELAGDGVAVRCTLALGHAMQGARTLHDGNLQAQEALYWALVTGRAGVVSHAQMLSEDPGGMVAQLRRPGISMQDAVRSLFSHAVTHGDYLVAYLLNLMEDAQPDTPAPRGTADAPEGAPLSPTVVQAVEHLLQLETLDEKLDFLMRLSQRENAPTPARKQLTQRLARYLDEHAHDVSLSLSSVADAFGYTSNYLSTLLKAETGLSFHDYLTRLRLERAAHLLCTTDRLVTDIAEATGFGHVNTFIRTFRKHYHHTPAQYRSMQKP